jgi:hypothetical protein
LLPTANSSVQAACELVGDLGLESEGPRVDGELGLGGLLRVGGLLSWVLLDSLHVNVLLVVPCEVVGGLDFESEGPRVDGELGLGFLLCLGGLLSWVLLVILHVNIVLDKVDSWRQSRRLCTQLQAWFLLASISLL